MCIQCGAVATAKLNLLAKACSPKDVSASTAANIKAFIAKKPLPNYPDWPFSRTLHPFRETCKRFSSNEKVVVNRLVQTLQNMSAQSADIIVHVESEDDESVESASPEAHTDTVAPQAVGEMSDSSD